MDTLQNMRIICRICLGKLLDRESRATPVDERDGGLLQRHRGSLGGFEPVAAHRSRRPVAFSGAHERASGDNAFFAVTVWRMMQSDANCSPRQIP